MLLLYEQDITQHAVNGFIQETEEVFSPHFFFTRSPCRGVTQRGCHALQSCAKPAAAADGDAAAAVQHRLRH